MIHRSILGLIVSGSLSAAAQAMPSAAASHHEIFMPENNLNLQDCKLCERDGGISKEEFDAVVAKAYKVFGPVIESHGGYLNISADWDDSTVNASAVQIFGLWQVNMYGGMARRPEITADGFTMVLCHEIGHHLGGFPLLSFWGAAEGQADYFASHVCPALWWSDEGALNAAARESAPSAAKRACDETWKTQDQQDLCYRAANAAKSVSDVLAALRHQKISFETRDTSEVDVTFTGHPDAQCRLDTYLAGAVCTTAWDLKKIPQSEAEESSVMCADGLTGARPHCWFKPGSN